jgi:pimeloyl-ACP methyl ester carboxylesterase
VRNPAELSACVLVNTSLRHFSPWHRRLRPRSYSSLLSIALRSHHSRAQEESILRLTSRNARAAAAVLDTWTALRHSQPVSRMDALRQLIAAARFEAPTDVPDVALLVLSSLRDALVDPRCSQAIADRWQCDHVAHPWAGHDLTLDDGEWVAEQVSRWVNRQK